jgi:hypothetical protein
MAAAVNRLLSIVPALLLGACATAAPIDQLPDGTYRAMASGSYGGRSHVREVAADAAENFCLAKNERVQLIEAAGGPHAVDPSDAAITFRCMSIQ